MPRLCLHSRRHRAAFGAALRRRPQVVAAFGAQAFALAAAGADASAEPEDRGDGEGQHGEPGGEGDAVLRRVGEETDEALLEGEEAEAVPEGADGERLAADVGFAEAAVGPGRCRAV